MRCLKKDPQHRFPSVEALPGADDYVSLFDTNVAALLAAVKAR